MKFKSTIFAILAAVAVLIGACDKIDSQRIPAVSVNLELNNDGLWNTYGVHSFGQFKLFIRNLQLPSNFHYTVSTYTGFGGLLIISGLNAATGDYNYPLVYDLACPVEAKNSVLINVDIANNEAYCKTCGSRYNVCELDGAPISGKALNLKYGLQRYHAYPSQLGGYTIGR